MVSYVVTGANRGIGFGFVEHLSKKPEDKVFALVRSPEKSEALKALNRPNVYILQADMTDFKTIKAAAAEVTKITGGKLDMLINNAALLNESTGYMTGSDWTGKEEEYEKEFHDLFQVNVLGPVHTINAFLPLLRKGSLKKVITLSSGMADTDLIVEASLPYAIPYAASKAAVNVVVAKYAAEFHNEGFTFLALSPGLVDTGNVTNASPEQLEKIMAMIASFKKVAPEWEPKPATVEESIREQMAVIEGAGPEKSGQFLSHKGNKQWL